jgi:hypothetical protein
MPESKPFPHQVYTSEPPRSPHHRLEPPVPPPIGSDEFRRRMRRAGAAYRRAGVAAVYLAHGTFVGPDALGILAALARVFPAAAPPLRKLIKRLIDRMLGEAGNFTAAYARLFEEALRQPDGWSIPVRLFHWSSENHHLGRADGAVRLIEELATLPPEPEGRVLLFGHSHAGNVFALATHLLSGNPETVRHFFDATAIYYRWPLVGCVDVPVFSRVQKLLAEGRLPFPGGNLDLVTFGTPIRYGWNPSGYGRLLHFIYHRPWPGMPDYQAAFPPKLDDVLAAAGGDYVQQMGIAGTNVAPNPLAWRCHAADRRLARLFEDDLGPQGLMERFRTGAIVPDAGTTLLVDYGPAEGHLAQHAAGHAVYTRPQWLLFHAEEVARRFYNNAQLRAA